MSFYDLNAKFRPIDTWPGEETRNRGSAPFKASWSATVRLLGKELRQLQAKNILCLMALRERDIRLDGYPRADAKPTHPGVTLSFDSKHGPLKYACDSYCDWQDNVRAIALGLEALRKVERYGITKRGEQYTGWKALPASTQPVMTTEQAADFLVEWGRDGAEKVYRNDVLKNWATEGHIYYRRASKRLHPDTGGDASLFQKLQEAKRILDAHHSGAR